MKFPESTLSRLECQHLAIRQYLKDLPFEAMHSPEPDDKGSLQELIAYVCRYQQIFSARIERIISEINPFFEIYTSDVDKDFRLALARPSESLLQQIDMDRKQVIRQLRALSASDCSRIGTHATMGKMNIVQWTDFFLFHECHQLFKIFRQANRFWESKNQKDNVYCLRQPYLAG